MKLVLKEKKCKVELEIIAYKNSSKFQLIKIYFWVESSFTETVNWFLENVTFNLREYRRLSGHELCIDEMNFRKKNCASELIYAFQRRLLYRNAKLFLRNRELIFQQKLIIFQSDIYMYLLMKKQDLD